LHKLEAASDYSCSAHESAEVGISPPTTIIRDKMADAIEEFECFNRRVRQLRHFALTSLETAAIETRKWLKISKNV
jgi:hypothetical protein